jgi:glycosyltransferase involved in cell wall biosynthesis
MKMKRIAMISEHASPLAVLGGVDSGGQNVYVSQLARLLPGFGFEVDVFTRRDHPDQADIAFLDKHARLIHVPAGPAAPVRKEELLPYMGAFADFLVRCNRGGRIYDLVHAHFFMSALVATELKRAASVPFVVTFHALGRVRRLYQGGRDTFPEARLAIEERVVREADKVIAECPQDESDLINLYDANPARLATIPCGFDPAEFWPMGKARARKHLGLAEDEPIVLQLGRMVPRKGVDNVIRGLARLRARYGVKARLLIVGGDSEVPDPVLTPEIGRLKSIAGEEGVADAVTFVGSRGRDQLRYYYCAADVFVTTPWYEPFGITPVEAAACGTPVVGASVGGIKTTVVDNETGYLVPPHDPDALADRLARLFHDRDLAERLGRQAVERANSQFTWQRVTAEVARVYDELLEARPQGRGRTRARRRYVSSTSAAALRAGLPEEVEA